MLEMNRNNIRIDPALEVDTDWNPPCIVAYTELWFDVDEKLGTHTNEHDDKWVNMYAIYSPVYKSVHCEYYIESDAQTLGPYEYIPTEKERALLMDMIEETSHKEYGCSCIELMILRED